MLESTVIDHTKNRLRSSLKYIYQTLPHRMFMVLEIWDRTQEYLLNIAAIAETIKKFKQ